MNSRSPLPVVGFFQLYMHGLLDPEVRTPFGGAEVRAMTFARMLRDSGAAQVAVALANDSGSPLKASVMQGMRVSEIPVPDFGEAWTSPMIVPFLQGMGVDCLVSIGANPWSDLMVKAAKVAGIPTVVGLASDQSLKDSVFPGSTLPDDYGSPSFHVWDALAGAGRVLAQTQWQKDRLFAQFGRDCTLIRNPIPAGWETPVPEAKPSSTSSGWAGPARTRTPRSSSNWPAPCPRPPSG